MGRGGPPGGGRAPHRVRRGAPGSAPAARSCRGGRIAAPRDRGLGPERPVLRRRVRLGGCTSGGRRPGVAAGARLDDLATRGHRRRGRGTGRRLLLAARRLARRRRGTCAPRSRRRVRRRAVVAGPRRPSGGRGRVRGPGRRRHRLLDGGRGPGAPVADTRCPRRGSVPDSPGSVGAATRAAVGLGGRGTHSAGPTGRGPGGRRTGRSWPAGPISLDRLARGARQTARCSPTSTRSSGPCSGVPRCTRSRTAGWCRSWSCSRAPCSRTWSGPRRSSRAFSIRRTTWRRSTTWPWTTYPCEGAVRCRACRPPKTAPTVVAGLHGPPGWLAGVEPGDTIGLRYVDGELVLDRTPIVDDADARALLQATAWRCARQADEEDREFPGVGDHRGRPPRR